MSPSDANPVKGSSSPPNATYAAVLTWEVFVTPGIPIVTADRPPGVRETYFQAMASTLIYGARDAVLDGPALKRAVLGCRKLNDRKTKLSETNRETLETQFAAE